MLVAVGLVMAIQPLGAPAHLPQKWDLLTSGHLYGLMDWFDLILHSGMLVLAVGYTLWLATVKLLGRRI